MSVDQSRLPISIYVPSLRIGGAQNIMVKLANFFSQQGHLTSLIVNERAGTLADKVNDDIELVSLDAKNSWAAVKKLARHLQCVQPPVLLSALVFSNISALLARRSKNIRTRIVISERNTASLWLRNRGPRQYVDKRIMRAVYPLADAIVAVSHGVAEDLSRLLSIPDDRIDVIHNPTIDASTTKALADEPLHDWFGQSGSPIIVAAGSLSAQKDFSTLIKAFAKLKEVRQARLLILGDGPERKRLTLLVQRLGLGNSVSMPGFVDHPICYFRRSSLFVLSSLFEGFPNVLVEALASGVPIVSTDCPSGPKEILQDKELGCLVPAENADCLAAAMHFALDHPGDANKRTRHAQQFSVDTIGLRYLELLRRITATV